MDRDEEHEAMGAMIHRGKVEEAYAKMQERTEEHNDLARRAWQYQADVAKLREALEPFSKIPIGVVLDDCPMFDACNDDEQIYQTHGWPKDQSAVVTVGDLRRARVVLADTKGDRDE